MYQATPQYCQVFQNNGDGLAKCAIYRGKDGLVVYPFFLRSLKSPAFSRTSSRRPLRYYDTSRLWGHLR